MIRKSQMRQSRPLIFVAIPIGQQILQIHFAIVRCDWNNGFGQIGDKLLFRGQCTWLPFNIHICATHVLTHNSVSVVKVILYGGYMQVSLCGGFPAVSVPGAAASGAASQVLSAVVLLGVMQAQHHRKKLGHFLDI